MRKKFLLCLVALAATMWSATNAQTSGTIDTSFGTNGIAQATFSDGAWIADEIERITVYPDGKILAVGSTKAGRNKTMALARFNADGSLDNTFGKSGQLNITHEDVRNTYSLQTAADVKILEDGKILVCGRLFENGQSVAVLLKLNTNGTFDTSFGTNGVIKDSLTNNGMVAEKMALQSDGKILIGGYYKDNLTVIRYNADGSRDASYGTQGMCTLIVPSSENHSYVKSIDIQADGKVIVGGHYSEQGIWKWVIARINTDGTADNSFGYLANGIQKMSIGEGNDFITTVKVLPNGKILVGGHSWDNNPPDMQYSVAFVQLNADGSWDKSFAADGGGALRKRLEDGCENYLTDMVVGRDGKIYGSVYVKKYLVKYDIGIIAVTSEGKLNTAFSEDGMVITDVLTNSEDNSKGIVLQPNGKIVVATVSYGSDGSPFNLVRYHSDIETGIKEVVSDIKTVSVYPNPTTEILNIAIGEALNSYKVQIFDMAGSVVMTAANTKTLNVSQLGSGNYIVKIISDDKQVFVSRFAKK